MSGILGNKSKFPEASTAFLTSESSADAGNANAGVSASTYHTNSKPMWYPGVEQNITRVLPIHIICILVDTASVGLMVYAMMALQVGHIVGLLSSTPERTRICLSTTKRKECLLIVRKRTTCT